MKLLLNNLLAQTQSVSHPYLQNTIASPIRLEGIGLHSGAPVRIEILPAKARHGIVFQRIDLPGRPSITASPRNITKAQLSTTLGNSSNDSLVGTVEHLMAALAGLGIDNALVKVTGPEIPVMDGSSREFAHAIVATGIRSLPAAKRFLLPKKKLRVEMEGRWMTIEPHQNTDNEANPPPQPLEISCRIEFPDKIIGHQEITINANVASFFKLADARTFCYVSDVDAMQKAGFAKGGSLDNAVVVGNEGILNPEGLRSTDEFVRHKVLDCIGDLGLLGFTLTGRMETFRPGHALHAKFMQTALDHLDEYFTVVDVGSFARPQAARFADRHAKAIYG